MKLTVRVVGGAIILAALVSTVALASVDTTSIGRTDPRRAARYSLPWFNFSENYSDGSALGVTIGSAKIEAIEAAERAGFVVEPAGWGDNRAGGASLYDRRTLVAVMLRQQHLNFHKPADLKCGMTLRFDGDRVGSIEVHYINAEAI